MTNKYNKTIISIIFCFLFFVFSSFSFALSPNISTNGTKVGLPTKEDSLKLKPLVDSENKENIYIRYSNVNGYSATGSYLTIKNDGSVEYSTIGRAGGRVTNSALKKIQLTKNELINLRSIVKKSKLFDLNDSYKCEKLCPTDMNTTSIEYHYYEKTKNISLYVPKSIPKELQTVITALKNIQKKAINAK